MRKRLVYAAFLLALPVLCAEAQVSIQASVAHDRLAEGEPVSLNLEIMNQTASPLDLSQMSGAGLFTVHVQSQSGRHHELKNPPLFSRPHSVQPWTSTSVVVNLQRHFDIHFVDGYTAYARIKADGRDYASNKVLFDVVAGADMGKIQVGVGSDGGRYRTYRLISIYRDRSEHLFLHIMNEDEGVHYGTHDLGRIIKMFKPVLRADREGSAHVLHQSGPTQYTYAHITAFGAPKEITLYTAEIDKIRLDVGEEGQMIVKGGKPLGKGVKALRRDSYDAETVVPEF